jgi:hypothetical protein
MATTRIEQLRAELNEAIRAEDVAQQERRASVPIEFSYWVRPADGHRHFGKIYDSSCVLYRIGRTCLNRDEAKAVGHPEHEMSEGAMDYIYNRLTDKIVCSVGGGTTYIGTWGKQHEDAEVAAIERISDLIKYQPEGGDITAIIEDFKMNLV